MADKNIKKDVFDRQAYFKEIRQNILKNIGLPEDTKPSQVIKLLKIKEKLALENSKNI